MAARSEKDEPFDRAFGRAVRARRVERGLSQEALSFACGRHRTYVSGIERGTSSPTLGTVRMLGRALGISASELIRRAEADLDEG
ncbi:MAG: helix-turn-helix transcriptional regulator [Acidimicrobiales bacterium]|nr:helix-turn-helix transcriptional regulator [Acidimicrobiales bacterium]MCB1015787.1 helix-turn-helix transcriptional regulator [Acidimicrobiales bacterium]